MKILAIDYGMKRMGFAVGNTILKTATPIGQLAYKNNKQAFEHIGQLVGDYEIQCILLGYPLNMDGSKSDIASRVEGFARRLKKSLPPGIGIEFMDERLSSFEADEQLKTRRPDYRKRKKIIDSMAALVILQRYMETVT
jgi:putative Holliday junction resolvase